MQTKQKPVDSFNDTVLITTVLMTQFSLHLCLCMFCN